MKHPLTVLGCLALLAPAPLAHAQGVQTGTITGSVKSADGLSLPGVTVTAASPALQGQRATVTDVNGVYFIKGLPAGTYTVSFEISAFKPATAGDVQLNVGSTVDVNETMSLAGVVETINVTAETKPAPLARPTLSQVYSKTELDPLPVGRVPNQIADLAPGLTSNGPNAGQVSISGATAFDNVFMMNGVDINDNLFGTANNLFIEDAIQETNVLTGGISAEYGRFTGGVINVITKSGGNSFSGSFRENFGNLKWLDETPRQKSLGIQNADILSKTSEGTFGGPIAKDRLWFFSSGRYENANSTNAFILTVDGADLEPVHHGVSDSGGHEVIRLKVRPVRPGPFQSEALEPRPDVVGGRAILFRVGQPAAHGIAGEEEEIRTEIFLADRFVLRRALLRCDVDSRRHAERDEKRLLHAGDYAPGRELRKVRVLDPRGAGQIEQPCAVVRDRCRDVVDRVAWRPVVREIRRRVNEDVGGHRRQQRRLGERHRARLQVLQRAARRHAETDDDQAHDQDERHRRAAHRQRTQCARRR